MVIIQAHSNYNFVVNIQLVHKMIQQQSLSFYCFASSYYFTNSYADKNCSTIHF